LSLLEQQNPSGQTLTPDAIDGKWWQSFLVVFSVATWVFGLPLYSHVTANDFFSGISAPSLFVFIVAYHVVPLFGLYALDRLIVHRWRMGRGFRVYRGVIYAGATFAFLRAGYLDRNLEPVGVIDSLPTAAMLILGIAVFIALTTAFVRVFRPATSFFLYLSIVSFGFTILFVVQVGVASESRIGDSQGSTSIALEPAGDGPPVIIIVFDGLGSDILTKVGQIDEELFPQFSSLGKDSAVFPNATSNYFDSQVSIQSLLTGAWLEDDEFVESKGESPRTVGILSVLSDAGYSPEFFSNANSLIVCEKRSFFICGEPSSSVIGNNIHQVAKDFWVRFIPRDISSIGRDLAVRFLPGSINAVPLFPSIHQYERPMWHEFLNGLNQLESQGKAYFVHVLLPHHPYELNRNGDRVRTIAYGEGFEDLDSLTQNYRDQTVFVDTLVGQLTDKLKAEGLYRRSTLVITSDHGPRSLGLGQKYAGIHHIENRFPNELNSIIPNVPLIIHAPNVEPQVSQADYQHIDLMPTLVDILELAPAQSSRGVSVFAPIRSTRERLFHAFPNRATGIEKITYIYDEDTSRWIKNEEPVGQ
jgi:hypothetical protein